MFDIYHSEFNSLARETQLLITEISNSHGSEKNDLMNKLHMQIGELKDTLFSLKSQYQSLSRDEKNKLKNDLESSEILFKSIVKSSMLSPSKPTTSKKGSNIEHMLMDGSNKLEHSIRIANETNEIGNNVIKELNKQSETINKIQRTNNQIISNISDSNSAVNKMSQWWKKYF